MSLHISQLDIPDAVRAGNEAVLTCDYDLEVGPPANINIDHSNIN